MNQTPEHSWTINDSVSEYGVDRWGDGYFSVSPEGTVVVSPSRDGHSQIDLKSLVDRLRDRGLQLPILIRFNGILRDRLHHLNDCFTRAINDHDYKSRYRCVFPIKVNQQREVVQQIVSEGSKMGFGVEAGSKPELIAAIAMSEDAVPIVCNGFKDEEYVRLALMAQRLGRTVFPVIEKATELDLIFRVASEIGVRPTLGMRVKLATRGSGRWQASGGYRSKFGLTVAELLAALDRMIRLDLADCFQLLHFHVGSQIGNIRHLKAAILEAARIYVDLQRRGAAMGYMDVGGGLGVDYDGSQTDTESSRNYSIQEYANDVVFHVQSVCDEAGVPHPQLISESGRAIAAQHSVLVVETLGVSKQGDADVPTETQLPELVDGVADSSADTDVPHDGEPGRCASQDYEKTVQDLLECYNGLTSENMMEYLHDAQVSLDLCMNLFSGGYLPLEQRVAAEKLYFALCHRVRELSEQMEHIPTEISHLDRMLSDIYFVNFSLFQSMPDAWAIGQMFPIMPIHRLDEKPTRVAVLGDITCDSDGKVESFVCGDGHRKTLRLHPVRDDDPYQLAIFMVGAYQEILGDLHNLFGDTHAVHVECEGASIKVRSIVKGDTVSEVLGYVQYDDQRLVERFQELVEDAIDKRRIDHAQAGQAVEAFEKALAGYTYLKTDNSQSRVEEFDVTLRVDSANDSTTLSRNGEGVPTAGVSKSE